MNKTGFEYSSSDSNDDCQACKIKCSNDTTCAGIECGRNRGCKFWNDGFCGTLEQQSRVNENYSTCMKYDEGDN